MSINGVACYMYKRRRHLFPTQISYKILLKYSGLHIESNDKRYNKPTQLSIVVGNTTYSWNVLNNNCCEHNTSLMPCIEHKSWYEDSFNCEHGSFQFGRLTGTNLVLPKSLLKWTFQNKFFCYISWISLLLCCRF